MKPVLYGILALIGTVALTLGIVFFIPFLAVGLTDLDNADKEVPTLESYETSIENSPTIPTRVADEMNMPYGTMPFGSASLKIGGSPTGGTTLGWTIPENYINNATRTVLLGFNDHRNIDHYAIDISTYNAVSEVIPVYSTLKGTITEITNASKPDYGEFVRARNARWVCVNSHDVYFDKYGVDDDGNCVYSGDGGDNEPSEKMYDGAIYEVTECCTGTYNKITKQCENGETIKDPFVWSAQEHCMDSESQSSFINNEWPGLGYGKTGNYEVVIAHLSDGSYSFTDANIGQSLSNEEQIGTMGTSGREIYDSSLTANIQEPMVHYEVWRSQSCPSSNFSPVNPETFLGQEYASDPGIPPPCCPPLELPSRKIGNSCGGMSVVGNNTDGYISLVNDAGGTLWGDFGIQITCNGGVIWEDPVTKLNLIYGEDHRYVFRPGEKPPYNYDIGNVGACPSGGSLGLIITQLNSGDFPQGCQGNYQLLNEGESWDDAEQELIAERTEYLASYAQMCSYIPNVDRTPNNFSSVTSGYDGKLDGAYEGYVCKAQNGDSRWLVKSDNSTNPPSIILSNLNPIDGVAVVQPNDTTDLAWGVDYGWSFSARCDGLLLDDPVTDEPWVCHHTGGLHDGEEFVFTPGALPTFLHGECVNNPSPIPTCDGRFSVSIVTNTVEFGHTCNGTFGVD